ncbi:MAG: FIST C-terminal domain-containing protein [Betaproteobacteria bacterium]|nr:FIST C-terminal domain-containing protein [Betaproteobacteria bacterium]
MTPAFRFGHASARNWRMAAKASLEALEPLPAGANLGFVYFSEHYSGEAEALLGWLVDRTGVRDWVGSVGIGVIATGTEYLEEPALALMVGAFPPDSFQVFSGASMPPRAGARTRSGAHAADFAVVHGDPGSDDMPGLIEDMSHKVESGFLVGGLSSSRMRTLQIANGVLHGGLPGVVFSSDIRVATRLTQGCAPLRAGAGEAPRVHRVTECERNIIVLLDGRPALDVFREDVGDDLARDLNRAAHLILAGLPIPASDTGDYLVRNLVGIDTRNRLIAIGAPVEPGMPIMFCRRGGAAAREDLQRMLKSIALALGGEPAAGLYYSCLGRGANMFGAKSAEMQMIRDELGNFPMVGFFANGEISHDRLYGYTGVLTLFV